MDSGEEIRQREQNETTFKSASSVLLAIMMLIPHAARLLGVALPRDVSPITASGEDGEAQFQMGSGVLVYATPVNFAGCTGSYFVKVETDGESKGAPRQVSTVTELAEVAIQLVWVILNERCPSPENVLVLGGYTERLVLEPA